MTRPYQALRERDFRRLWLAQLVSLTGSQMQVVAINWHIYLITRSALALGFVGLTRVLPIVVFSLWGGLLADRRDRRRVMLAAQTVMALVAVALALLAWGRRDGVWAIYALNAVQAAATAFDGPARQALVPRLVTPRDLPGALSLNLTAFHASMIAGPALGGLLIAGGGSLLPGGPGVPGEGAGLGGTAAAGASLAALASIYLLNALSFLCVIFALATMRTSGGVGPGADQVPPLTALREGLRFVFRTPIMVWTTLLDFFATFFAGSLSLLPIYADQVLRVGPQGYGWLAAAPALGAFAGSLYTTARPLPRNQGRVLLWCVAAYGFATIVYGVSRSYPLALLALAATGLSDLVSTVIRQTLRQLITPDALRGRMTAVSMVFFMGGPQLGEMEAGLVASLFASTVTGVTVSIVSGGVLTVLVAATVAAATPVVRAYQGAVGEPSRA